jgi:hypothetical protein
MDAHEDEPRSVTYQCVVGHPIPEAQLEVATEIRELDDGAEIRVCREHGAPISMTIRRIYRGRE